jgi:hypothetical protein
MLFNPIQIIKENYESIKKESNSLFFVIWLLVFPAIVSVILIIFHLKLNSGQYTNLIAFISILIGFLINILVMMVSNKKDDTLLRKQLTDRIYSNVSYFVISGVLLVILILIESWFSLQDLLFGISLNDILLFFVYFIFLHIIIILLMIIKGFYSLYK